MSARLALRAACTVKSCKTFLLSLFHLEYYLGLHSLLGPEVAVLFLPFPPLQDRLRTAGSLPSTATLASENHTDDIRIVGDDDEVKTGLQNRSGIPDAMTKASINCHNGCNFYPLRFAISGV